MLGGPGEEVVFFGGGFDAPEGVAAVGGEGG